LEQERLADRGMLCPLHERLAVMHIHYLLRTLLLYDIAFVKLPH